MSVTRGSSPDQQLAHRERFVEADVCCDPAGRVAAAACELCDVVDESGVGVAAGGRVFEQLCRVAEEATPLGGTPTSASAGRWTVTAW